MTQYRTVAIGDILKKSDEMIAIDPQDSYKQVTVRLWGKGVTLRREVRGSEIKSDRQFLVRAGQFITSRIDARNGAFGLIPSDLDLAIVTNDFPVFSANESLLHLPYLDWLSKTQDFLAVAKAASEGTTNRVRLKEERFLHMKIPLPPLEEQRRIVARIEEIGGKIEEARQLKSETFTERALLANGFVDSTLKRFNNRKKRSLGELATKIGSGSTPTGGRAFYPPSGIPFIRSQNVLMRQFTRDGIVFIDDSTHEQMDSTRVLPGDVLLNITGASIGRVAIAPPDLSEANVNQHVSIIRPADELLARFLMYWISQPSVQSLINSEQKGATRQGFTKAQIERLQIPDMEMWEQEAIVGRLDSGIQKIDSLAPLEDASSKELDALLPSVLDKAFKGEL